MTDITSLLSQWFKNLAPLDALLLFMLIFTRWLLMTIIMPVLGAQILPSMVRIAFACTFTAVSFLIVVPHVELTFTPSVLLIALLFIKEAVLGFILGFFASLIFYAYELVGEFIDLARAASMSKMLVPELKHQSSSLGVLTFQLALVMFLSMGFHREFITTAYQSFTIFPVFSLTPNIFSSDLLLATLEVLAALFELAFRLAIPVILICFLIDVAFGLMNRVAPQINAYFLSLPAKIVGGLIMLFFVIPFVMDDFIYHQRSLARFFMDVLTLRP